MIRVLADTSVWVAHFRVANPRLQVLLAKDQILCHPLVLIEIACGTPPAPREKTLGALKLLQKAAIATSDEILALIESKQYFDTGCGATDIALLASTLITDNARLWTLDRNLAALAIRLKVEFDADRVKRVT